MAKQKEALEKIAGEWMIARDIIKDTLAQCYQGTSYNRSEEWHERVAVVIIATLAVHNPPILLAFDDASY
jgi:hypothetical protein